MPPQNNYNVKFTGSPELGANVQVPQNPILPDGTFNVILIVRGKGGDPNWASRSGLNAVIVAVEAGGIGSTENRAAYGRASWVNETIDKIERVLKTKYGAQVHCGNVGLASFSGGYDAINQILSQRSQLKYPITSVMMFDGMHHSITDDPGGKPNAQMKPYIDYAKEAMKDPSKKFIILHSAIPTEVNKNGYPSTTQTSDYILRHVGLQRHAPDTSKQGQEGWEFVDPNTGKPRIDPKTGQPIRQTPASFAGQGGFGVYQVYGKDHANDVWHGNDPGKTGGLGFQHLFVGSLMPQMFKEQLANQWNQGQVKPGLGDAAGGENPQPENAIANNSPPPDEEIKSIFTDALKSVQHIAPEMASDTPIFTRASILFDR